MTPDPTRYTPEELELRLYAVAAGRGITKRDLDAMARTGLLEIVETPEEDVWVLSGEAFLKWSYRYRCFVVPDLRTSQPGELAQNEAGDG